MSRETLHRPGLHKPRNGAWAELTSGISGGGDDHNLAWEISKCSSIIYAVG